MHDCVAKSIRHSPSNNETGNCSFHASYRNVPLIQCFMGRIFATPNWSINNRILEAVCSSLRMPVTYTESGQRTKLFFLLYIGHK